MVTALKAGVTRLTVTAQPGGVSKTITVTVKDPPPTQVTSVSLSVKELKLKVGEKRSIRATATPAGVPGTSFSWSLSQPKVASLKASGDVVSVAAVRPGTTWLTVRATPGSATARIKITVAPAKVTSISTSVSAVKVRTGSSATVTVKAGPAGVAGVRYSFSVANKKVVKLSARGASVRLTGLKPGVTSLTVSATPGSAKKTIKVTVQTRKHR